LRPVFATDDFPRNLGAERRIGHLGEQPRENGRGLFEPVGGAQRVAFFHLGAHGGALRRRTSISRRQEGVYSPVFFIPQMYMKKSDLFYKNKISTFVQLYSSIFTHIK
jgi:hypothetical protein